MIKIFCLRWVNFRLPLRRRWYVCSSATLCSVLCSRIKQYKTFFLDFLTLEEGTDRSITNYHRMPCNSPEEHRTHFAYNFAFSAVKGICSTTVLFSCNLMAEWNIHFVQTIAYNSNIHIYKHLHSGDGLCVWATLTIKHTVRM